VCVTVVSLNWNLRHHHYHHSRNRHHNVYPMNLYQHLSYIELKLYG